MNGIVVISHRPALAVVLWAAMGLAGCSEQTSAPSAQAPEPPTLTAEDTAQSTPSADSAAQPSMQDCDMSGMDMSKMSAEEHQKMMEECEKAKRQSEQN